MGPGWDGLLQEANQWFRQVGDWGRFACIYAHSLHRRFTHLRFNALNYDSKNRASIDACDNADRRQ